MILPARFLAFLFATTLAAHAQVPRTPADVAGPLESLPAEPAYANFKLVRAPAPGPLLLRKGDRLAICGDSITEQKMYSRIIETYLTACVPELEVTVRQYGWGGETAEGFLRRMTNDCLRFKPTIATTCYGMNDHRYRTYDPENGQWYRNNYAAVIRAFKAAGARVVIGSAGSVGKVPGWTRSDAFKLEDLNLNLATFRNIASSIATDESVRFADVFWPMYHADTRARARYGAEYAVPGKDGVHPGWAGQLIMAHSFLTALGLDGDLGTFKLDLDAGEASASAGHKLLSAGRGVARVRSSRYPFCAEGELGKDTSIRSGMEWVPFNEKLNRLMLVTVGGTASQYKVTWGSTSRTYAAAELRAGVNLAADFVTNPFSAAFKKVDEAVAAKQAYETRQVKTLFHGDEGRVDMAGTVALTERVRRPLVKKVAAAFVPVEHEIRVEAQ